MKPQELAIGQEAINPAPTLEEIIKWQEEQIKNLELKALSDGEIERIYFQTESVWDKDGNFQYLEFARAILRKAQENG